MTTGTENGGRGVGGTASRGWRGEEGLQRGPGRALAVAGLPRVLPVVTGTGPCACDTTAHN